MSADLDSLLYRRIKQGDLSAFDPLYERHKLGLFKLIYGYLKNREESEEVFHEAFIQVLQSREIDFESGSFQGWIYLVARNISLNRIRSRKRGGVAFASVDPPVPLARADEQLIEHDEAQALRRSVAELPEDLSQVLNLRLSGLPHKEIAQVLEIPLGTVKSRFHSLVKHLKKESESI